MLKTLVGPQVASHFGATQPVMSRTDVVAPETSPVSPEVLGAGQDGRDGRDGHGRGGGAIRIPWEYPNGLEWKIPWKLIIWG